jgi:spermidine synthase
MSVRGFRAANPGRQTLALLWHKQVGDRRYEVRSAGNSRRLYTNGVFHSQYNPRHAVTGSVWDLLMLPAFFAPQTDRRVLVLGVGGGAVVRLINRFVAPRHIVGVELDAVHLDVARRYFEVMAPNVTLHRADAVRWVERYRGPRFDMIVDDLFGEADGEPSRAVAADSRWFGRLADLLTADGVLVANFDSPAELQACAWCQCDPLRTRFPSAFRLMVPNCENAVGAFLGTSAETSALRRNLAEVRLLESARRAGRLRYHVRRLHPA